MAGLPPFPGNGQSSNHTLSLEAPAGRADLTTLPASQAVPGWPTYLDLAGGQGKALASRWRPQGDRVELALVEVGHGRLA